LLCGVDWDAEQLSTANQKAAALDDRAPNTDRRKQLFLYVYDDEARSRPREQCATAEFRFQI
jgi:hypothetical protein